MSNPRTKSVEEWRNSGDYLPDFLKDFHDRQDFFKTMHQRVNVEGHEYAKTVDWVTGYCYTIDIFLWDLARFGYKIQKSHARVQFDDLTTAVDAVRSAKRKRFIGEIDK